MPRAAAPPPTPLHAATVSLQADPTRRINFENIKSPIECFKEFFTDDIVQRIRNCTIERARRFKLPSDTRRRETRETPTDLRRSELVRPVANTSRRSPPSTRSGRSRWTRLTADFARFCSHPALRADPAPPFRCPPVASLERPQRSQTARGRSKPRLGREPTG